tara:strand:+ start:1140 stop:1445 length:306 start_codon:yes stop_codon:yes gene_type:complete
MNTTTTEDLVNEVAKHDPMLAGIIEEKFDELRDAERRAHYKARVDRAESNLGEACVMAANDPTGQDGEDYANPCARDLIDARDSYLRHTDPEQWMERRMGA